MNINEILTEYIKMDNEHKKLAVHEIVQEGLGKLLPYFSGEQIRIALRIFADAGKGTSEIVQKNSILITGLLKSEDPKVRMLTAEILGNSSGFSAELITACHAEQTMFTLPSFLLAIGAQKTDTAKRYLEHYTIRSEYPKHQKDEKEALQKALANYVERKPAQIRIMQKDIIALSCPNMDITLREAKQKGLRGKISGEYVLLSGLEQFRSVYDLRTFSDAYLLLGISPLTDLPQKLSGLQDAILSRMNVTNYRLEVGNVSHQKRMEILTKCIPALDKLINTPSAYSFEIRLNIEGDQAAILLNPLGDTRFSYRKKAVSASISPSVAASICYAASSLFHPGSRVLDNFCGSGTLLFERSFYPHASLTGVDIAQSAIAAAQENEASFKCGARFFHMDSLRFTDRKFDEILCNMPFGLRVGTHAKNERLYESYVSILPAIMDKGGHAFLYTHEKHLLEDLLKKRDISYISKTTFTAGGLFPALYILQF